MEKRCVITGLGLICAAGNDVDTCWQNICAGKTGIDEVKSVSTEGCVSHVGAEVHCENLPAPEYDRSVRLCLHAAHEAVRDGRLTDSAVREAGVILGSCVGGAASIAHYYTGLLQGCTEEQDVLKMSASAIAANTAFALGANGETANIVNACAAGTMSVSYACDLIRLGRGEIFLAGGTDAFSSLAYAGFNALHALSAGPCSPLNHSNGISLGEGAGVLVVEEYEHAIRRGAKIYCEVAGWGVSSDAFHITAPQPQGEGQMAALHRAMVNAGTEAGDIGYINAHGTGTAKNDAAEFLSLHTLFEGAAPSVSSTKSMTGHCLGAAGAIEAVLSVKALTENTVLPTTGYAPEDLAPLAEKAGNLDCVVNVAHERELENVMSNSFAFGGTNASIIFSKKPHPAEQTGKRRICVTGIGELLSEADGTASVQRELTPEDFGARDVKLGFYRKLDRFSQMQVLSGVDALRDAGFTIDADNASRVGSTIGTADGPMAEITSFQKTVCEKGPAAGSAFSFPHTVYNAAGGYLSIFTGLKGFCATIANGTAARPCRRRGLRDDAPRGCRCRTGARRKDLRRNSRLCRDASGGPLRLRACAGAGRPHAGRGPAGRGPDRRRPSVHRTGDEGPHRRRPRGLRCAGTGRGLPRRGIRRVPHGCCAGHRLDRQRQLRDRWEERSMSIALVTGASRGIGRACALALAKRGYDVAVNYVSNEAAAQAVVAEIEALGVRSLAVRANTAELPEVKDMFRTVVREMGGLDVLVNNAGVVDDRYLMMLTEDSLTRSLDINIKGYFHCAQQAALKMFKKKSGVIVNISSVSSVLAIPGQSVYSATKGAVNALTATLAKELAPYGIRVNAVAPGFVETEMLDHIPQEQREGYLKSVPMGRFAKPEEIGDAVCTLCDPTLSYLTGQTLILDGGLSL